MNKRRRKKTLTKLAQGRRITWREKDYLIAKSSVFRFMHEVFKNLVSVGTRLLRWFESVTREAQWIEPEEDSDK